MNLSVLIIDDEPMICMGILKLIDWAKYGFSKIDIQYSYEDGLKAASDFCYTLIISDIRIHQQSGLDLIRKIKDRQLCENFIVISAYAEFEYARTAIECGVMQYILKPINREDLLRCVEEIAISNGYLPEPSLKPKKNSPEPTAKLIQPKNYKQNYEKAALSKSAFKIRKILNEIHKDYGYKDLSLTNISEKMYMNPSYIGRCFIEYTGLRFSDYLNYYRIIKACELLPRESLMIYEICECVGFNSLSYFHRTFKKVTGYTTTEYRHKIQKRQIKAPTIESFMSNEKRSNISATN